MENNHTLVSSRSQMNTISEFEICENENWNERFWNESKRNIRPSRKWNETTKRRQQHYKLDIIRVIGIILPFFPKPNFPR